MSEDGLTVLSNAREISSEVLANGKRLTRFADTVKMSTYLVAVIIGPFELTTAKEVDGVPVRIGSVTGRSALRGLAEEAAVYSLDFLRNYFSMPYPADKLDHIAVPDFAAGAMENLGLVIYRETALLIGPDSSQVERLRVVSTIAHETAHMWFGDLVTMRWWEGIWLNEAFATFMELLVTDKFEPRWDVWTTFGVDRAAALATDSLHTTRAIEYPVGRPEEAEDMFDGITYDKGGSVLRMIERFLGDETFRLGLKLYLEKHRFSNTSTTDLWDALETASGEPVRATMGTWVNQAGHPLVTAERAGPSQLRLSQRRFLLGAGVPKDGLGWPGAGDAAAGDAADPATQLWVVPVTLRYATEDGNVEHHQLLLRDASTTVDLKGEPAWALVNEGAWGVYRSHYDHDLRQSLFGALEHLDGRERLSLTVDTWAATVAGLVPLESALELWLRLRHDGDPDVWWAVQGGLSLLDLVAEDEDRAAVQALARQVAGGLFADLGWQAGARPGDNEPEPPRQARLRARLVTVLGTLGADPEVRAEARRRLADADAGTAPLPPDLATAVTQVVASAGAEREWDILYAHYKQAATPQDEVRYLHALGAFSDQGLLRRSIELAFSPEVRSQDAPTLLMGILGRREGCALAWEALEDHWQEMLDRWPPKIMHRTLESLPALVAAGESWASRAGSWLDAHPMTRGIRQVAQSRERLQVNLAFKRRTAALLGPLWPSP